jgi:oxygen-independent coproporphyrinogen-3 oxidase
MKRHEGLVARYLDQLERDLDDAGAAWGGPLDTLYLGGGTPSHLTDAELTRLMNAVTRNFDLTGALEVTLEADPGTFDAARAAWFKDLGVTRLSIGVQSTQAESLANLGRTHTKDSALQAIAFGQDAGLAVSADLMTAVPQQDAGADAKTLVASGVNHLSVYTLTIEPGTPFALRGMTVSEDRAQADDQAVRGVLRRAGFDRYEVSNWARPGFEAVHNRRYWTGGRAAGGANYQRLACRSAR